MSSDEADYNRNKQQVANQSLGSGRQNTGKQRVDTHPFFVRIRQREGTNSTVILTEKGLFGESGLLPDLISLVHIKGLSFFLTTWDFSTGNSLAQWRANTEA